MKICSFLPLFCLRVFVLSMVLWLGACSGGGGASGGASSGAGADGMGNYLPDAVWFMPEHFTQAELEIENARFLLRFTCLREYPTGDCISGSLASAGGVVMDKNGNDGPKSLHGSWEQRATNSRNGIHGLCVYRRGENGEEDFIDNLSLDIQQRVDTPSLIDDTIILAGTVASGTLICGTDEHSLIGAKLRLVYTIDSAQVSAQTHGAPQAGQE